ncbi:MAG: thioesterase family protein [Caulobacterales bacterium]
MLRLDEAPISPFEIDHLGHMNVRHYGTRARRGVAKLFEMAGLPRNELKARGVKIVLGDVFNHYLREQFEGAMLVVQGGVSRIDGDGVEIFVELINEAKDERAATFLIRPWLCDVKTRARVPVPEDASKRAAQMLIDMPAYAAPRSLDLSKPVEKSFAEIEQLSGGETFPPQMTGVKIKAEACDEHGYLKFGTAQEIMMTGFEIDLADPLKERERRKDLEIARDPAGRRIALAQLENRQLVLGYPRVGDNIKTFSATFDHGAKTLRARRWVFNQETGALYAILDNVMIALDLDARRAVNVPDYMRANLKSRALAEPA